MTNNAPKTEWIGTMLASGVYRQRLFIDGIETRLFIDTANGLRAHRTQNDEHGLYGAGMQECTFSGRDGHKRYVAAMLGSANKIAILKHRAEQIALNTCEPV